MSDPPMRRVGRRVFLKLSTGTAVALVLPGCAASPESGEFLDSQEWRTLDAAQTLLVPDARAARAVAYVDALLSAFDHDPPRIFAGGPFSGRHPFGDPSTGLASRELPPDDFSSFLPLSPGRELAWRIRIFGSASVPGGDFNHAVLGEVRGWRDLYRDALARMTEAALAANGTELALAPVAVQRDVLDDVSRAVTDFRQTMFEHAIEGTYGDPIYGGNAEQVGWTSARWDGDSQPLGHAVYTDAGYVDLAERPTAGPDPSPVEPFSREVMQLLDLIVAGTGGERFF